MDTALDPQKVRKATRAVVASEGYAGVTHERVATAAGCSPDALRRSWPSRAELVFSALVGAEPLPAPPDMGSLEGDLMLLIEQLTGRMGTPHAMAGLPHILGDLDGDADLHRRFLAMFTERHLPTIAAVLERAVAREEIAAAPGVQEAHALITGPLLTWFTVYRAPVDDAFQHRLAHALAAGLRELAGR